MNQDATPAGSAPRRARTYSPATREAYDCEVHSTPGGEIPMTSMVISREGISAAEVLILQHIHGEQVKNIKRSAIPPRDPEEDLRLLRRIYGIRAEKSRARAAFEAVVGNRSATQLPARLPPELLVSEDATTEE